MRLIRILILLLCFSWIVPLQAQDTPYQIALQHIEEARVSGATELYLCCLGLTELPPEIKELTNLHILRLYSNHLETLPPEIGQLTNLQVLDLMFNELESLPPEIGQLTNLRLLALSDNKLSTLSANVGRLTNLCVLGISYNNLQYLPNSLGNITRLSEPDCFLALRGNHLISPPEEVIAQGTPAILAYLRNQAWWHIRKMIIYAASVVGGLALLVLGLLRWRRARLVGKKKREA